MLRKMLYPVLALALVMGTTAASVEPAHARGGRGAAIAAGILGLAILGATASRHRAYGYEYDDYGPRCYRGRERCYWSGRRCFENDYGDTICRGGDYVCRRPLICD